MHIIDDSEYPTMITKINMPFMYARRVIVNTYYPKFNQGSVETVSSSINNEQTRDQHRAQGDNTN